MLYPDTLPGSQSNFGFGTTRTITQRAPRLRRGRVVSFDSQTWEAVVQLDGAMAAVEVPVGDWVNPATLAVGVKTACLLFDDNNPDDAVIVGVYGSVGGWDYFQRDAVPAGHYLTIPASHTMTVHGPFSIVGSLTITGRLFIE